MRGILGPRHAAGLVLILIAGWVWVWAFTPARAEPYGWRIEVRACRGTDCRLLPISRRRWPAQFACDTRAGLIAQLGPAPRGRTLQARCVSVAGTRGA